MGSLEWAIALDITVIVALGAMFAYRSHRDRKIAEILRSVVSTQEAILRLIREDQ